MVLALALVIVAVGARLTTAAVDAAVDSCSNEVTVCVAVPDVEYELLDDAMVILEQVRLVALAPRGAAPDRMVLSQRPGPGVMVPLHTVVRLDLVPRPSIDPTDPVTTATPPPPTTTTTPPPPPTTTPPTTTGTTSPPSTRTTASVPSATTSRPQTSSSTATTAPPRTSAPSTGPSSVPGTTVAGATTTATAAATTTGSSGATLPPTTAPGPVPPRRPVFDPVAFVARHARGGAPVLLALAGSLLVRRRRRSPRRARRPGLPLVARFGAQGRLLGTTGGEGGLIARFAPCPPLDPGALDDHDPE